MNIKELIADAKMFVSGNVTKEQAINTAKRVVLYAQKYPAGQVFLRSLLRSAKVAQRHKQEILFAMSLSKIKLDNKILCEELKNIALKSNDPKIVFLASSILSVGNANFSEDLLEEIKKQKVNNPFIQIVKDTLSKALGKKK